MLLVVERTLLSWLPAGSAYPPNALENATAILLTACSIAHVNSLDRRVWPVGPGDTGGLSINSLMEVRPSAAQAVGI